MLVLLLAFLQRSDLSMYLGYLTYTGLPIPIAPNQVRTLLIYRGILIAWWFLYPLIFTELLVVRGQY